MAKINAIKILADLEAEAILFAEKCSRARKQLEKGEGLSPASRKGKEILPAGVLINITNKRRKNILRKAN